MLLRNYIQFYCVTYVKKETPIIKKKKFSCKNAGFRIGKKTYDFLFFEIYFYIFFSNN